MRLDTISGSMSILSMRMSTSPGNEINMMTSSDGSKIRATKPIRNPRKTPVTVSTSSKFVRSHFHGYSSGQQHTDTHTPYTIIIVYITVERLKVKGPYRYYSRGKKDFATYCFLLHFLLFSVR